ncbi:MAG: hypothetical protein M0T77_15085 [Actinomycetota bacterium]|nr:hypothetical protein [Actinomycetota bacterium]
MGVLVCVVRGVTSATLLVAALGKGLSGGADRAGLPGGFLLAVVTVEALCGVALVIPVTANAASVATMTLGIAFVLWRRLRSRRARGRASSCGCFGRGVELSAKAERMLPWLIIGGGAVSALGWLADAQAFIAAITSGAVGACIGALVLYNSQGDSGWRDQNARAVLRFARTNPGLAWLPDAAVRSLADMAAAGIEPSLDTVIGDSIVNVTIAFRRLGFRRRTATLTAAEVLRLGERSEAI